MGTRLDAAVDELLDLDPAALTDDELHEAVVAVHRQSHRLAGVRAELLSVWDARRVWSADGSRSAGHRLAREASMSVPAAKREVRRARALASMPHTRRALDAGTISPEHVDVLADANDGARAAHSPNRNSSWSANAPCCGSLTPAG